MDDIDDAVVEAALGAFDAEELRTEYPSTKECVRAAIRAAVMAEREACIADLDELRQPAIAGAFDAANARAYNGVIDICADAIRARGNGGKNG